MKPLWAIITPFAIGAFLGFAVGMTHMNSELRTLRGQVTQAAEDGKVCCDAAYVAIRYRPECGEAGK